MEHEPADAPGDQSVGWMELFFDLVFVVAIAQLSGLLHNATTYPQQLGVLGLVLIVWTIWFNEVASTNISRGIAPRRRVFVLLAMAGVGVMAVGIPRLPELHALTFVVGNAIARCALAAVWVIERRSRGLSPGRALFFGPGLAAGWVVSAFLPPPWLWWAWALLVVVELWFTSHPASRQGRVVADRGSFEGGHMLERVGSFVMICFGETVALLAGAVVDAHDAMPWVTAGLGFGLIAALFWMFYDVTMDRVGHAVDAMPDSLGRFLGFSQLLVVAGLVAVATGVSSAVAHADQPSLPGPVLRVFAAGTAMFMVGVTALSFEALRVMVRIRRLEQGSVQRGTARWIVFAVGAMLVQAVVMPIVVLMVGSRLAPWLVIVLLSGGPVYAVVRGAMKFRRGRRLRREAHA